MLHLLLTELCLRHSNGPAKGKGHQYPGRGRLAEGRRVHRCAEACLRPMAEDENSLNGDGGRGEGDLAAVALGFHEPLDLVEVAER